MLFCTVNRSNAPMTNHRLETMRHSSSLTCLLLLLTCLNAAADDGNSTIPPGRQLRIFDGSPREICYRTSSHAGSKQLQELMNMVPGGEKITVFKMPYKWSKQPEEMRKYPVHVRRMNNNFGPAFKIEDADDRVGIDTGVEFLEFEVAKDLKLGLKAVFYHTGHYNENTNHQAIEYIYNTRYAYHAFSRKNTDPRIHAVDCLTLSKKHFPATVRSDGFHASATANYIEAAEIVKAMCRHDDISFPQKIQALVDAKVRDAVKADVIEVTYPDFSLPANQELRVGDTITIRWKADPEAIDGVYVLLHAVFRKDYYLSDIIKSDKQDFGKFTWKVSRELPLAGNRPDRVSPEKAKLVTVINKHTHQNAFCFRVMNANLAEANDIYSFSTRFRINFDKPPREEPMHFDVRRESE